MGTYAWNILCSKILPAKSCAQRRRPPARPGRAQSGRTPEFGYGPLEKAITCLGSIFETHVHVCVHQDI